MLEVLFDFSSSGSLKAAKAQKKNESLNNSEIIPLSLKLDIGYLLEGIDSKYRIELPDRMYSASFGDVDSYKLESDEKLICEHNLEAINTIIENANKGAGVRIWYSESSESMCGFYYICSILYNTNAKVYALKCPHIIPIEGEISGRWGVLDEDMILNYLNQTVELSKKKLRDIATIGINWFKKTRFCVRSY